MTRFADRRIWLPKAQGLPADFDDKMSGFADFEKSADC